MLISREPPWLFPLLSVIVATCAVSVAVAAPVKAQGDVDEAREAFAMGNTAADEGRTVDAIVLFTRSLELAPRAPTALNLAVVQRAAGRFLAASHTLGLLLTGGYGDHETVRDRAIALRDELDGLLPRVEVTVTAPEGTTLRLDGDQISGWVSGHPVRLRVDPGRHVLLVGTSDGRSIEHELRVGPSERQAFALVVEAEAPQALVLLAPPSGEGDAHDLWSQPWLHVGLGAALLLGISGLVVGLAVGLQGPNEDPAWGHAEALVRF